MRVPSRLVFVVIAGALGCGSDLSTDMSVRDLAARDQAVQDLAAPTGDGCALTVQCTPVQAGANCAGTFCGLNECPPGCQPFV